MQRRNFIKSTIAVGAVLTTPILPYSCRSSSEVMATNLTDLSAVDLSNAIKNKNASCVEIMKAYLDRIHKYNPVYNAIVSMVDDDQLIQQAKAADAALAKGEYWGWMHGMPHAVKDLAAVKGMRYTSGSPIFAERIAEEDSDTVARIRSQGAIFIGKTNTPEFGLGCQTYNPVFGSTGNAYNPDLTCGGSSGGAACGLATRMLPVADGGDMMGSLRNPGAFNNVIGFRPSTNFVSGEGNTNDRALATSGPMGRNTRDLIQLLNSMSVNKVDNNLSPIIMSELKIGWLGDIDGYFAMESGILDLCEKAIKELTETGAKVESTLPDFNMNDVWVSWTTLRHHRRLTMMEYYDDPMTKELLKPELIWEMEQALSLSENDVQKAQAIRSEWYAELDRLFSEYDFLILPTAQVFPFDKTIPWPKEINGKEMDTYHRWMEIVILGSLGGIPVINVPVGFDDKGRPMGMQVMGRFGDDEKVLKFALAYEEITDFLDKRPKYG
ncbi:MAG: amidase [Saprospiraceae bacterium]|nr:amidase [Saprospiraceae bacterium]